MQVLIIQRCLRVWHPAFRKVDKDMRKIEVDHLEIIGKGVTATVYLLDEEHIVKVFRDIIPMEDIQYEYDCARLVEGLGIRTPCAREIVSSDQGTGIIYDRVKGLTLSDVMQKDKEHLYDYGVKYGRIVKSLHEKRVQGAKLPDAKEKMLSILDDYSDFLTKEERDEICRYIELVPPADCLLHGDIAPVNIMVEDGQMIIIDVPMIMKGNPLFDLLQPYSFCVQTRYLYELYMDMPEDERESPVGKYLGRFKSRYLNAEESQRIWDGFLMGYFGRDLGEERENLEYTLRFFYSIRQIGSIVMRKKFGDEVVRFLLNRGMEWIRNHKDEIDKLSFSML